MPLPRWRSTGFRLALATGCVLTLAALPLADLSRQPHPVTGPFTSLGPARLDIQRGRGRLELQATSLSAQHEARLNAIIARHLPELMTERDYRRSVLAPGPWVRTTEQALMTIATLDSGRIVLDDRMLHLSGVTRDPAAHDRELQALVALLPADVSVTSNEEPP